MKFHVTGLRLNDDMRPEDNAKYETCLIFFDEEDGWTHSADLIIFIDRDEQASVAELKQRAARKAEAFLRAAADFAKENL